MMFEKVMSITQQTIDNTVRHWFILRLFAGPRWALLMLVFTEAAVALVSLDFFADHLSNFVEKQT